MKNKFIRTLSALLLTGALVIGLSACGGNDKSESSTDSESTVAETESAATVSVSGEETDEAIDSADSNTEEIAEEEPAADLNNNGDPKLSAGDTREYWLDYENTFKVYCPAGFYEPEVWAGSNIAENAQGHIKKFEWFYVGESGNVNGYDSCPRVAFFRGDQNPSNQEGVTVENVTYGNRSYQAINVPDYGKNIRTNENFDIDSLTIFNGEIPDEVITQILETLPTE